MADRYAGTALTNGYEFTQGSGYELPEYLPRAARACVRPPSHQTS